jgi:cellulose synthase/poly-beta-1,6-N-acetylglucosamine synthase-like glycosyltransferase
MIFAFGVMAQAEGRLIPHRRENPTGDDVTAGLTSRGWPPPPRAERKPIVVALIPAHNEEASIAAAVASVLGQVSRVVVVSDNSTDQTTSRAAEAGAELFETDANRHKKAGALNQALAQYLPELSDGDLIFVMDADSRVVDGFVGRAAAEMADPNVGAVAGIFFGESGGGVLGALQRNEYTRYAREIGRKQAKAMVLTGTSTLLRVSVAREVAAARGTELPGRHGDVYDTDVLTEDNELTLAVKSLGYKCRSPKECVVTTEVMPRWGDLWRQRLRWQRGALENIRQYGLNRVTAPYALQQAVMAFGTAILWTYLVLSGLVLATGHWSWRPFWLGIGALFFVERLVTVKRRGWRAVALAASIFPEFVYDLFLQAVMVRAAWDALTGREATWHHVGGGESLCTRRP